jgi:hypothetical protein
MTKEIAKELPPLVKASDTTWPKWKPGGDSESVVKSLTFYKTERMGWVIVTLLIGRGTRGQPDRYYGITLDGKVCRVGKGPHVKAIAEVHVRKSREEALKKYLDLYEKGMGDAGSIRDRIGSRRAQGQIMRAQGRHSWMWDN